MIIVKYYQDQRLIQSMWRKVQAIPQNPRSDGRDGGGGPPHVGFPSGEGGMYLDARVVPWRLRPPTPHPPSKVTIDYMNAERVEF